jgi:hypothetical protein
MDTAHRTLYVAELLVVRKHFTAADDRYVQLTLDLALAKKAQQNGIGEMPRVGLCPHAGSTQILCKGTWRGKTSRVLMRF